MQEINAYEKQAQDFLTKYGLKIRVTSLGEDINPLWDDGETRPKYKITISKKRMGKKISFTFWDSIAHMQEGKEPSAYDILACISGDTDIHEDFNEFCSAFGYDVDSIKALRIWRLYDRQSRRLHNFFSEQELEDLREIC